MIRDLDTVSRWASEAATFGGGRLFNFSLRVARSQAWGAAERLHPLDEAGRRDYMSELDELVSVLAYLITRPICPVGLAAWLARRCEQRDPRTVTRALSAPGKRTGSGGEHAGEPRLLLRHRQRTLGG